MRRDLKTPLTRAALVYTTMLLSHSAAIAAPAPIRYGHGVGGSQATSISTAKSEDNLQYAALTTTTSSLSGKDDAFFYPDEPINARITLSSFDAPTAPKKASLKEKLPNIPHVSPAEYKTYVKIGKPYTVNGKTYIPHENPFYDEIGTASWYGSDFHGKKTANGEKYDMRSLSAAHPTLPLPSYVLVTNEENGRQVVVRINDRGPFKKGRIIDMSEAAAERLDMIDNGTAKVRVQYLGPAEKAGTAPRFNNDTPELPQLAELEMSPPAVKQVKNRTPVSLDMHFVQLGSFANHDNAMTLLEKASQHSDLGDVVFANVNGADRYRVILGPFPSKGDAERIKSDMSRNGFDGLVIRNP